MTVGRRLPQDLFRCTLDSIADAVIATNVQGQVTFMNPVAQSLTGWTQAEAAGLPLRTVLRILDEATREELESPIDRILRGEEPLSGASTLLVSRDGRETPIEEKASRIWNPRTKRIGGFVLILRDVTQLRLDQKTRQRLESELRNLTDLLLEVDRRKDAFLATLAHELRNPLAPLRTSLQLMKVAGRDVAAVERARLIMERQVESMVRLVDDLLDVSRITRGRIELRKQHVAVREIVDGAAEMSRPVIRAAGVELMLKVPRSPVFVVGDPIRLSQVVTNLLNNAAKYSREGERIWLAVERERGDRRDPGQVAITVSDSGAGIPLDFLPHVFEMFVQDKKSLKETRSGLGVGLSLVKRLVEMHGGTVEAHSAGPGKGSEFVVHLPVAAKAEESRPAASESGTPIAPSRPRRVLVVDDNVDAAESLGMLLRMLGNEVQLAHDGPTALAQVLKDRPDVVLLDIGLPVMNGYEVARRIRQHGELRGVMLAALTGWGSDEDRRRSQEAGFDHHLVKPIDLPTLSELLASCADERN